MFMKKLLIIQNFDWADEISCEGFTIINADEWDTLVADVQSYLDDGEILECYIGTNEMISIETFEEFNDIVTTRELDDSELETLTRLFGDKIVTYGFGNTILSGIRDVLVEYLEDIEDDDKDESNI